MVSYAYSSHPIPPKDNQTANHHHIGRHLRHFFAGFWPILLALIFFIALDLPPAGGILFALLAFLIVHKVPGNRWFPLLRGVATLDSALLVFGSLFFKLNLQAADAVPQVVDFLTAINMPPNLLIFILPCLVAFLTRHDNAHRRDNLFPFLIDFIGTGPTAQVQLQTLAFAGLLTGVFLTPIHLCLALSISYFDTPYTKLLARLVLPTAFIAAAGILMALFCH